MAMEIHPLNVDELKGEQAKATWRIPGSKSITNRALILCALTEGKTLLQGVLHSDDTRHMINALRALGISITEDGSTSLVVEGGMKRLQGSPTPLFIGNSGTSVRFLTAFACLVPNAETILEGNEHMAKRPLQDLIDGLRQLGVSIECATGCPPLTIKSGETLAGGEIEMEMAKSSQYASAIMLSGSCASEQIVLKAKGNKLVSMPYLKMTKKMVVSFGGDIDIDEEKKTFLIKPKRYVVPASGTYTIEPDASAASYAFAAAAVTGTSVSVPDLDPSSMQGDYAFVNILKDMGCTVEVSNGTTTLRGPPREQKLKGVEVDMFHISDTVMTLAAIAPLCDSPVTIKNVANIRIKETDRLAATVTELKRLGQEVEHGDDWLKVTPKPVLPAKIECYADHRIAMSFAVLGLAVPGVTITDPKCSAKTYPLFWEDLQKFKDDLMSSVSKKPKV